MLELFFETPDPHVDARGGRRFVLYRDANGYPLPDVVLATQKGTATVPVQEATIGEINASNTPGAPDNSREMLRLRDEIRSKWSPKDQAGPGHVAARHVVAQGRVISADVVRPVLATTTPAMVEVTWRYLYTGDNGVQSSGHAIARLEFAALDARAPVRNTRLDAEAERRGVPAPVRTVGVRSPYRYFAAIDFGTSASTVTLYDARSKVVYRVDPAQASVLGTAIVRLLRTTPPGTLAVRWGQVTKELADRVGHDYAPLKGADLQALCNRLENVSLGGAPDRLLDIVCAYLDRLVSDELIASNKDGDLPRWLGSQLLRCYDEAFDQPPLATLNLRTVELDEVYGQEVPTELTITDRSPVAIDLGIGRPEAVRNLKQKLGDAEPLGEGFHGVDGKDATTDDLIALVYKHLIGRTEEFARDDDPGAKDEALTEVVATFPTTTPAGIRQHLTKMLEYTLDLTEVAVSYDEGVAAALYFLMRDFSGTRPEFGAEALRARSRKLATTPPQWQQNMLVIDIGAGTTDIALLRLTLFDDTRPIPGVDPAVQGKYYIVQPEVINSTGHPQLGGNYLTLRVFYWLKAAIIDAMLRGGADLVKRRELAGRVRQELGLSPGDHVPELAKLVAQAGDVERPVPAAIAPVLSALLPTHWGPDAKGKEKDAFWLLWRNAEAAKIELGSKPDGDPGYVVAREEIVKVLNAIDVAMSRELEPLIPPAGVLLPAKDFQDLASPVLAHAANLAWWLVQQSLGGSEPERLDRIMLSGKTSIMELTRHVITEKLGTASTGTSVAWNPTAISVERRYAKQAASIGAAWAAEIKRMDAGMTGNRDQLAMGRSILKINVDNVFTSLPCEFRLRRSQQQTSKLFDAGTPLVEIDRAGTLAAREEWINEESWPVLVAGFEVHRPVQPNKTQVWGTYRFSHDAKTEGGFTPDSAIWLPSAMGEAGAKIRAQVQIDQRLNPTLNICQGRPHYLVNKTEAMKILDIRAELPVEAWNPLDQMLAMLPAALVIVGASTKERADGEEVLFPEWLPLTDEPHSAYFPDYFHADAVLDSDPMPGRIAFTLPPPASDGRYRLLLRKPGEKGKDIGAISVTAYGDRTVRYTATLDASGIFALHRGTPPFWAAGTLRDVEVHPGAVLHRLMEPGKTDRNPRWDPFTGNH